MIVLIQKHHPKFKPDVPLRNWEILGKADRYSALKMLCPAGRNLVIFEVFSMNFFN